MDKNTVMLVAIFVADMLVQTKQIPEPRTKEEADFLIAAVARKFLLFVMQGAAMAAEGEGCECEGCPDAAHCPDRKLN